MASTGKVVVHIPIQEWLKVRDRDVPFSIIRTQEIQNSEADFEALAAILHGLIKRAAKRYMGTKFVLSPLKSFSGAIVFEYLDEVSLFLGKEKGLVQLWAGSVVSFRNE